MPTPSEALAVAVLWSRMTMIDDLTKEDCEKLLEICYKQIESAKEEYGKNWKITYQDYLRPVLVNRVFDKSLKSLVGKKIAFARFPQEFKDIFCYKSDCFIRMQVVFDGKVVYDSLNKEGHYVV